MIYLVIYAGIGVLILGAVLLQSRYVERKKSDPDVRDFLAELRRRQNSPRRYLEEYVVPLLAGLAVILAWPVALVMLLVTLYRNSQQRGISRNDEFRVGTADLLERLSIGEIEERERVSDPLGAVPDEPFGHLHELWQKYRDSLRPDDELWSFELAWNSQSGDTEYRCGYAAVRKGQVGPLLVTQRREIDVG